MSISDMAKEEIYGAIGFLSSHKDETPRKMVIALGDEFPWFSREETISLVEQFMKTSSRKSYDNEVARKAVVLGIKETSHDKVFGWEIIGFSFTAGVGIGMAIMELWP